MEDYSTEPFRKPSSPTWESLDVEFPPMQLASERLTKILFNLDHDAPKDAIIWADGSFFSDKSIKPGLPISPNTLKIS